MCRFNHQPGTNRRLTPIVSAARGTASSPHALHNWRVRRDVATAPISAGALIAGYAVAVLSGSRTVGGVVLAGLAVVCIAIWARRDGARTAAILAVIGLLAFAMSHLVGLVIGAWPAVLLAAAVVAIASWRLSDSRRAASSGASAIARSSS